MISHRLDYGGELVRDGSVSDGDGVRVARHQGMITIRGSARRDRSRELKEG